MLKHVADSGHRLCNCGGYHYAHRPGSRFCVANPMSDVWIAARDGCTDDELLEVEIECAVNKPGKPFNHWRD